jgi:DNA-binding NtrC family response regulator
MARLLLVDDEAMLLQLLKRYLERQGHQVETAESAEAALENFGAKATEFDLVISDLTLPGMNGEQLVGELRRIHPKLPGVIASGYPFEPQLKQVDFLQKPFLPQMLVEQIEKTLKR